MILYAVGNIENSIANYFPVVLQQILIVALMVNPVLIGLIIGLKNLWDSVTDPIMAHITDNTRSRWGRRIPYIFVGGISRMIVLAGIVLLLPVHDDLLTNRYLETDPQVKEAQELVEQSYTLVEDVYSGSVDSREQARADLARARGHLASVEESLPSVIDVLERTLEHRRASVAAIDTSTREGAEAAAQGERVLERIQDRFTTAKSLVDEATNLHLLISAADARLEGALDEDLRIGAESKLEELKAKKLDRIVETLTPVLEDWRQRLASLQQEKEQGTLAGKDRAVLDYGQSRTKEIEGMISDARTLGATVADARDRILGGGTDSESPDILTVREMLAQSQLMTPPPTRNPREGLWEKIANGWNAFQDPSNADQKKIILFLLVGYLIFTTLTTVQSVPYFALQGFFIWRLIAAKRKEKA